MDARHDHVMVNVPSDYEVVARRRRNRKELFFRFMFWLMDSGLLARLKATSVKVYIAIGCFADFETRVCSVSKSVLARSAGVGTGSVERAEAELIREHLIEKISGKFTGENGRHMPSSYRLLMDPPLPHSGASPYPAVGQAYPTVGQALTPRWGKPLPQKRPPIKETESETVSRETETEIQCAARFDSDSVSGHAGVKSSAAAKLVEIMHLPYEQRMAQTALGKQTRSDLTTISRLVANAVTSADVDDARRQAAVLYGLAREAASSCGQRKPMAKLLYLAKQQGLYGVQQR